MNAYETQYSEQITEEEHCIVADQKALRFECLRESRLDHKAQQLRCKKSFKLMLAERIFCNSIISQVVEY